MRIVVVGAGAVGTCVAYRLARTGASVTLLGADPPERTLSAHSFAWVNPVDDGNADYWALTHEAQA
ncbi:FAD-dependent oxidoreductase, partial [Escherichia coli]|nr:FAD-dependent oxidoreductase [Escherichia coli]